MKTNTENTATELESRPARGGQNHRRWRCGREPARHVGRRGIRRRRFRGRQHRWAIAGGLGGLGEDPSRNKIIARAGHRRRSRTRPRHRGGTILDFENRVRRCGCRFDHRRSRRRRGQRHQPVLARAARETGALVLSFVTLPFMCEGNRRQQQARQSLEQLNPSRMASSACRARKRSS